MEKIFKCLIIFMLVTSCAKPKVIETQMPGDKKLGCEELELAIFKAKKFRDDAKSVKNGTGGNVTRLVFFWPAWAKSMHNADKAQIAADDAGSKAYEQGLRTLTVQVKGPGSGRETALRSLQSRGFKILSIKDTTPMPHNGARPPKRRRV